MKKGKTLTLVYLSHLAPRAGRIISITKEKIMKSLLMTILVCLTFSMYAQKTELQTQQNSSKVFNSNHNLSGNRQQTAQKSDSDLWNEYLAAKRRPLTNANEELYSLGDVVWQRAAGETEFFLAPSVSDVDTYIARIQSQNDKAKGIIKSKLMIVKVRLNAYSRDKLRDFNITVPSYYQDSAVNVLLPLIDVEDFENNGLMIEKLENYGTVGMPQQQSTDETRQTIWEEGWEGSMSPYTIGYTGVQCVWDDDYAGTDAYEGDYVLWCAGGGSQAQPIWNDYVNNMSTSVWKTESVNVSDYINVQLLSPKCWCKIQLIVSQVI